MNIFKKRPSYKGPNKSQIRNYNIPRNNNNFVRRIIRKED